ncbi:spermatogenesis-associated protein 2-like protein isoform X1 [Gambusia affinis]|uniref:spermatogenesis-associated protein 2-like protein isoform X1 n=2 Tax=Gambusia affinis TaxID=33528 RepID=UPI001CDC80E1|nr:spermatogenesis-associated protein 2-like protein isoform X1 [Gambusia affinis]
MAYECVWSSRQAAINRLSVMKDEEQEGSLSRRDLFEDYRSCFLRPGAEVRPCRDPGLLKRAAQFLLRTSELKDTFTLFPFCQAVTERCVVGTDGRKHLAAFIKATEMLESLCVNMFLQPWKKEIRSLKTFTGAFVYCLLPVLSGSTIRAVLACMGYRPSSNAPQSEFTLSSDADADRALLLGFELLLARLECCRLLDLLLEHQLGPQEWLDVLQRSKQPSKLADPTEKQTVAEQRKDNNEKRKESDKREESQQPESRPPSVPQPKPRRHRPSVDQSDMDLQWQYPDLAFRGRPLLPDQPPKATPAMTGDVPDSLSVLPKTNLTKEGRDVSPSVSPGDDGWNDSSCFRNSDESRVCDDDDGGGDGDDDLSGPQAISLHITLRTGGKAEAGKKRGRVQQTSETSDDAQKTPSRENVMADKPESSWLSSIDEEQQLRALAERMGQLSVQGDQEKVTRREDDGKAEGRKKDRQKQRTNL